MCKLYRNTLAVAILALLIPSTQSWGDAAKQLDSFSLPTCDGSTVDFSPDVAVDFRVLCFLGTECPLARVYGPRLQRMADHYTDKGVQFVGINSNVQDSMDDLKQYVTDHQLTFPVAKDFDRSFAIAIGATRTPEVIVVDRANQIRYRGRIDDQYQPGIARSEATTHDLRNAVDQLLAGEAVKVPVTKVVGCLISLPRKTPATETDLTYCKEVSRVLGRNCIECHRKGEIGPFALEDYDEIVGWADMMLEVIDEGRMPPWHASPDHGEFSNGRHMTDADKHVLKEWVAAGMPYGNAKDLPKKQERDNRWHLPRSPDIVIKMNREAFRIPADGTVEYQYFVVDPKFTEDKWIQAAELIPGNRSVVHHAIAFIRPPDGDSIRSFGLLTGYVPGQTVERLPKGYARRFRAGSKIVFQMHYTPNGREQLDNSSVGIVFADEKEVTHEVYALGGIQQEFEIPPRADHHVVSCDIGWFPRHGELLAVTPHMHVRGKSFDFFVERESNTEQLLAVPRYDFNWQHNYVLAQPMKLADVRQLRFNAVFDNSVDNPTNPNPDEYVTWGDQTWQEMALAFVAVAEPRNQKSLGSSIKKQEMEIRKARRASTEKATRLSEQFAADYIERLDKNGDKHVSKRELPDSVRMFYFWGMDKNGDELISHAEIQQEALRRFMQNPNRAKR